MSNYQLGKDIAALSQRLERLEAAILKPESRQILAGPNLEIGPLSAFTEMKDRAVRELANPLMRVLEGYAPPNFWGTWLTVASHGGSVSYDIEYEPLGDTVVYGQVNYYSATGWRTDSFFKSTSITTGNAWANVAVCFMGIPLGSVVRVYVNP